MSFSLSAAGQLRLAAGLGFMAILLGALGAHGPVHDTIASHSGQELWEKALQYQLIHALVLLALALTRKKTFAVFFFGGGILLFCGSLYLLALTGQKILGALVPVGGVCFLIGWALLFLNPRPNPV